MTAPPAVLLHGFTGSSRSWGDPVLQGLRSAGVEPIPLDMPGHGGRAEVSVDGVTLSDALAVVDEATAHLDHFDLVGYSMGGRIALHVALERPHRVRRLVLESASPGLNDLAERAHRRSADDALADRIEQDGVEAFVEYWMTLPLFESQRALSAETTARLHRLRLENRASGLAAALRGLGTGVLPGLWDRLGDLPCPLLLIVGALDRKFLHIAREMVSDVPDVRLTEVVGAGHTVHVETPRAWLDAVGSFLRDQIS
ncbi:MAG: 2-succinyl-6-hydroxy-2,4-cyclohexadiene-1-carboxylate synthase [Gemmatimonadota bacterium]|nr:2-succinyl-6-hydroxy-2,4-cyclohexadiene-1-carboxylate synthase [Gemmatimonadota bacterium]MDE3004590.1 2-succinyl-6-hydroxy-2,4-cyclohexadiene-1-carboxylate synthase [Gemmatimonadota bacterium]MDE3014889.1 2-succinyl-6-hydroxy-2,4-cyclohexadiene-1-carboxylate synthase [Gemmatimonadota bacterium]